MIFKTLAQYLESQKINENKGVVYLSKQRGDTLDYQIFRDLGNDKFQLEKGKVGNSRPTIIEAPINQWDEHIRHAKTRGFKEVDNLDVKQVVTSNPTSNSVPSLPHTPSTSKNLKVSGNSKFGIDTLNKLQSYDTHGVKLDLADHVQVQVDGSVKVLSDALIKQYNELLTVLKDSADKGDIVSYNKAMIKMNTIIKKKQPLSQLFIKDVNKLQSGYELEKDIFDAYLEISMDDFEKLETKTIKDKIADSPTLTKIDSFADITIEDIDNKDKDLILKLLGKNNEEWRYIDAFKIINNATQEAFDKELAKSSNKETKLLFHGSKVRNWLSIIKSGLKVSAAGSNAGTLFDNGIYFADIADKSLGYVDGGRWDKGSSVDIAYLAIYEVHTGNYLDYKKMKTMVSYPNGENLHNFVPKNKFDSYWAKSYNFHPRDEADGRYSLMRDEFIVYKNEKCTIKYLVQVKK